MKNAETIHASADLWRLIAESLGLGEPVVLATVIDRVGSGPREAGASLAVFGDGRTSGTVGGGLLEARVLEEAQRVHRDRLPVLQKFFLTAEEVNAGGMLCGGELEVLIDYLDAADPPCRGIFERLLKAQEEGRFVWLVRSIRGAGGRTVLKTGIGLMEEGLAAGSLDPLCLDEERLRRERRRGEAVLMDCGSVRCFVQPVGIPETVFIFGAGHVAQALTPLCASAGFRVVVIDDRPEYAIRERFPMAAEVRVTDASFDCFGELGIAATDYVVVVTHGHAHDRTVLAGALKTGALYIGMIASRRKRDLIFDSLRGEGAGENDLGRVHSPIGLSIGARTPAEIAVSIVAEMIGVRTGTIR